MNEAAVPLDIAFALAVLITICVVPTALLSVGRIRDGVIPFLSYTSAYYLVFFGLPILLTPFAYHFGNKIIVYHVILEPIRAETILLAAAGIGMLFAAYLASASAFRKFLPPFRLGGRQLKPEVLTLLYIALLVTNLGYRYVPALQALPSIGQFLEPVGFLAFGGLYLQWRRGQLPLGILLSVVLVALPLDLHDRMQHLYLTKILFLPLFFLFVLWRERQLRIVATLAVLGVLIAATYSLTTAKRYVGTTVMETVAAVFNFSRNIVKNDDLIAKEPLVVKGEYLGEVHYNRLISPLINRIGQIWVFQAVHDLSPRIVPYMDGATYKPLLTSFIPRVLYPSKPREQAGGDFGRRYGFLDDPQEQTSFNIPWLVELLTNFGPVGVVAGMGVFGLLLSALNRLFNSVGASDLEFLIGLTIIFRLGYQESNLSEMTGSLLPLFVALYIYFRYGGALVEHLCRLSRRAPSH